MPLRDHFQPPLHPRRHWESFHANWATRLADDLNRRLPEPFFAEEFTHAGARLEIDVASFAEDSSVSSPASNGPVATVAAPVWSPPAPGWTMPAVFPDSVEIRIFQSEGGVTLVGAIELISPGNKDRPEERRAFAMKCGNYLSQGISLVIIDIVTSRTANLHNETMQLLEAADRYFLPSNIQLYAVAYRPVTRSVKSEIDVWPATLSIGSPLPVLPLRLTGDLFVPVDFESAYTEACRHRRLP